MKKIIMLFSIFLLIICAGCSKNTIENTDETNKQITKRLASIRCESDVGELLTEYSINYGEAGNIESVEINEYDDQENITKTIMSYNDQGHLQKSIDLLLKYDSRVEIIHTYDEQGRLIRTQLHSTENDYQNYTDYHYDEQGLLTLEVSMYNYMGRVGMDGYSSYEYNKYGQLNKKYEYIEVSNYNHILTEYVYDSDGLLQEEKAECFEDLMREPVGYFLTTYSYDTEGRIVHKSYIEDVYDGCGGTWNTVYDYTYENIQIFTVSGAENYTDVTILHNLSEDALFTIKWIVNPIVVQENGDLVRIESKGENLIFVYEE